MAQTAAESPEILNNGFGRFRAFVAGRAEKKRQDSRENTVQVRLGLDWLLRFLLSIRHGR